jgi:sec-independent protein translocase protein TatA
MNLGAPEIILVMIVVFFFFGANKIPELMKGLGTGLREFKKAAREIQDDIEKDVKQIDAKKPEEEVKK